MEDEAQYNISKLMDFKGMDNHYVAKMVVRKDQRTEVWKLNVNTDELFCNNRLVGLGKYLKWTIVIYKEFKQPLADIQSKENLR